jgi:hypothetical protein
MKAVASLLLTTALFAAPAARVRSAQEAMARELLANFTVGRFEAASRDFDDTMRSVAPPKQLADIKQELDAKYGRFRGVTEARLTSQHGLKVVDLITQYDKSSIDVHVEFDAFNLISTVSFNPIIEVDPELEKAARELFDNFNAGRYDQVGKNFDGAMQNQLPPPVLANLARQLVEAYGAFHSVTEIHQHTEKQFRVIELTAAYDNGPAIVRIVFAINGRVTGMKITPVKHEP